MSKYLFSYGVLALAMLILAPHTARATVLSGNPMTDGWDFNGNALQIGAVFGEPGVYVGGPPGAPGDGSAIYKVYSNTTTITPSFLANLIVVCPVQCAAWAVGDTIYGLGAVFPADGGNQNNTASVFLKWGVTSSIYSLATQFPGNGNRDHNNGDGGVGSVLATLDFPGSSGTGVAPTTKFQWTGTPGSPGPSIPGGPYIAFSSIVSGSFFTSFEGYLNVTKLNFDNPNMFVLKPLFGGNSIVGVRNIDLSSSAVLETNALAAGVPEPATGLLSAGAFLAIWMIRRRQRTLAS